MTDSAKCKILWLVWLAFVIAVLWFMAKACAGAGVSQGDAALNNLLALRPIADPIGPTLPLDIVAPVPHYHTNWLLWDYAKTNWLTVNNFRVYRANGWYSTLWQTNWLAGLVLSNCIITPHGSNYTFAVTAVGTNGLESDFSNLAVLPVPLKTNLVVTITGTNMSCSTNGLKGPWRNVAGNLVVVTNFGGKSQLWRGSSVHETHTWK